MRAYLPSPCRVCSSPYLTSIGSRSRRWRRHVIGGPLPSSLSTRVIRSLPMGGKSLHQAECTATARQVIAKILRKWPCATRGGPLIAKAALASKHPGGRFLNRLVLVEREHAPDVSHQ